MTNLIYCLIIIFQDNPQKTYEIFSTEAALILIKAKLLLLFQRTKGLRETKITKYYYFDKFATDNKSPKRVLHIKSVN